MKTLGLGGMSGCAAASQQLPHLRKVAPDALIHVLQQFQHLLPGEQGARVVLQRLLFLALPEGSHRFQGESKRLHKRLAGGSLTGMGVAMACARADQLCSVVKPCSMPWQRN